ncbi:MAG TPA: DUF2071 domain-containing protein [Puia sp.]|nr:DUF2071 domain-containing protein [Puia sp.]
MKSLTPFLTAEWRKLVMANYSVDRTVLQAYLPVHTELDEWKGQTYVSLVGFMFRKVKVRGLAVPYHTEFPEVNLRFYVRRKEGNEWKRGVVFISEIVPKPAITWIANTLFRERYRTLPMRNEDHAKENTLKVGYQWKYKGSWNTLKVDADAQPIALEPGSKEEFITEHFWGYTAIGPACCGEYEVAHPRWNIHPVHSHGIECNFGDLYGQAFAGLKDQTPASVFLAEGSPIKVFSKKIIA